MSTSPPQCPSPDGLFTLQTESPPNDRRPTCHTAPRFPPRVGAGVNNLSYNTIEKKNNTAIFNMIPCIFPAGWHPSQGQCALVLYPPRAGKALSTRARPVLLALAPGHNPVASTLPPCPAVVLKLQDNVNLISLASKAAALPRPCSGMSMAVQSCLCSQQVSLSPRGCGWSPGPIGWKAPSPKVRARCMCLVQDTRQFLPSPRVGA